MDPECYKRLRSCNKLFSYPDSSCLRARQHTWSYYKILRSYFKLPTVHAAEVSKWSKEEENVNDSKTSLDTTQNNEETADVIQEERGGEQPSKDSQTKVSFKDNIEVSDDEVNSYIAKETGKERVKQMFSKNLRGEDSYEKILVKDCPIVSGLLLATVANFLSIRAGKYKFIQANRATTFKYPYAALKEQNLAVVKNSLEVGFKWGFQTYILSFMFLGVSQVIAVYRNKSSPFEYGIGAAFAGSFWKIRQGPREMMVGGGVAGAVGLVLGTLVYLAFHLSGEKQEQRHFLDIKEMLIEQKFLEQSSNLPSAEETLNKMDM